MKMMILHFNRPAGFPSLSGTFGILTRLALNPKMPKEPSSPSRSYTRIERHCIKNETNRLRNNNGQRTTRGIKHWGLSGYASILSRIKVWCRGIVTHSAIPNDFIPPTVGNNPKKDNRHEIIKQWNKINLK